MTPNKVYVSKFVATKGGAVYTPGRWLPGEINVDTHLGFRKTKVYLMQDFAVHNMIGASGYALTHAPSGFRMTSRDRVFRTIEWAMCVGERLHPLSNDWSLYSDGEWPFPSITEKMFNYVFDVAETQGAFLDHLIAPSDRVTIKNLKGYL